MGIPPGIRTAANGRYLGSELSLEIVTSDLTLYQRSGRRPSARHFVVGRGSSEALGLVTRFFLDRSVRRFRSRKILTNAVVLTEPINSRMVGNSEVNLNLEVQRGPTSSKRACGPE